MKKTTFLKRSGIMNKEFFKKCWNRLCEDEQGATAIEYGLFAALISVVIIGAVTTIP